MNDGLKLLAEGVITHNLILFQGLGIYALLRFTKSICTAAKAALVMLAATMTACALVWGTHSLIPHNYSMRLPFDLLIALAAGLFWHKLLAPVFGKDESVDLRAAFFNSALVGVLLAVPEGLPEGPRIISYGMAYAVGYGVVLIIMAGIRARLELVNVPRPFKGVPILLISAALLALALMGYRL
ncbi:MAG: Rnf-Nqr domain containing protein [Limnochordia bacterium]|jgi:electron transport complex protein RnfA|nr:hypothetical protein [Bacillota bacterium]HOB08646.1 Rnf-Nqr domain containing protein [Limnochordia bacterium]HPT92637.1 Rnf-Nqr domain containing protein [Limnochordia bacterium]HPZ30994.1 Rnf-Nqr domain containing protein [Limnochordia bacterium]HQD71413.1 Rnf-Nqr domain containing protein [Limnochordia bacterium]